MHILRYLTILFILHCNAYSLQIENVYFGFNNSVHSNSFNFVNFTIYNDTAKPYEGSIKLKDSGIGIKTVSTKEIFLTPNQKKSLQMYFYVEDSPNELILEYGKKREEIKVPQSNAPANIFISSRKIRLPRDLKFLPETNFPFSVAYTHGLFSVVIDTVPDWTPKQKKAFMDWLKLGGNVFVLKGQSGKFPRFTSSMAELNNKEKRFSLGSGIVTKVDSLMQIKFPTVSKQENSQHDYYLDDEENIFANLQLLVKTDHNWAFIYLLIILYLILIGPINYMIGRKTRDWKLPNLFFLLTVILFSVFFSIIGRRGYGEETKLNSFTLADHISENNFLVKQWSNIFVTSGSTYSFKHDTEDNLYASPSNFEMATKIDQTESSFVAEIPLFSSKRMIHMGTGKGHDFEMIEFKEDGNNVKLKVESSTKIKEAWFVKNGTVYKSKKENGTFSLSDPINFDHYYNSDAENAYKVIEKIVLKQASRNKNEALNPRVDPYQNSDSVHFYALTETPNSFHSVGEISDNETGWTLNRFKLNLNEAL